MTEQEKVSYSLPWCEKYRPLTLDDLVGNEVATNRLKSFCASGRLPNMILSGPSGTGKTSALSALKSHCLQRNIAIESVEMNASDERGIDAVRTKIKEIVCKKAAGIKLLILDEADGLTISAQHALKSIMDRYPDATFAFSCNDISKLLPQLQSRCCIILLEKLTTDDIRSRLKYVVTQEDVPHTSAGLKSIAEVCEGDCRNAINRLQTLSKSGRITTLTCNAIFGKSLMEYVNKCLTLSNKVENHKKMYKLIKELFDTGHDLTKICLVLITHPKLFENNRHDISTKIQLSDCITDFQMRSLQGNNDFLQACALFTRIHKVISKSFTI